MPDEIEDAVALLKREGYSVAKQVERKWPFDSCYVCGAVREEVAFNPSQYIGGDNLSEDTPIAEWLLVVEVVTNPSEEGYDRIVRHFCDVHQTPVIAKLRDLGFYTHNHGSTNMLARQDCPGAEHPEDCVDPPADAWWLGDS